MATVYYNGDILTMASGGEGPEYVECLVTTGDSITYTGDLGSEVRRLLELGDTVKVDLRGKSLLPGFIDPHIHPSMAGETRSSSIMYNVETGLSVVLTSSDSLNGLDHSI